MTLYKKLNFREGAPVVLVNLPGSLQALAAEGAFGPDVRTRTSGEAENGQTQDFPVTQAVVFARTPGEVAAGHQALGDRLGEDPVLWFSYPKKTSSIPSAISRDDGWEVLEAVGLRPVRQVAIDGDWSALRFRDGRFVGR